MFLLLKIISNSYKTQVKQTYIFIITASLITHETSKEQLIIYQEVIQ